MNVFALFFHVSNSASKVLTTPRGIATQVIARRRIGGGSTKHGRGPIIDIHIGTLIIRRIGGKFVTVTMILWILMILVF